MNSKDFVTQIKNYLIVVQLLSPGYLSDTMFVERIKRVNQNAFIKRVSLSKKVSHKLK